MKQMRWTAAMSVGVPELDDDHKGLVGLINRLADLSEKVSDHDAVKQCLVQLMRYAESHFGREQKVMSVCSFPDLVRHMAEHRDFIERIQTITRRFDEDPVETAAQVNLQLVEFLKDWLNHHILIEDKAYRPYVEKKLAEAREAARSFRGSEIWWSR